MARDEPSSGHVIVLNGGSSAGKSTIGRTLQSTFDGTWLLTSIDVLIWIMPPRLIRNLAGLAFADGVITRGDEFMRVYAAFRDSVAAMAHAGVDVIVDDAMIGAASDQRMWDESLADLEVCWVGVRCSPDAAAAREAARGDRPPGIARRYALAVHEGVRYDVEVDTEALDLAHAVAVITSAVEQRWGLGRGVATNDPPALPVVSALTPDGDIARAPWER